MSKHRKAFAKHIKHLGVAVRIKEDRYTAIGITRRELGTILAALRYWQREGLMSGGREQDIATDCGAFKPLGTCEIAELCERINT